MKRRFAVSLVTGVALLLAAAAVQLSSPAATTQQAAFAHRVDIGQPGTGRDVEATVHRVLLARGIHSLDWDGSTPGIWVVAEVTESTVLTTGNPGAMLRIGAVDYDASDRPGLAAMNGIALDPGLPYEGAFLFEIPRSAVDSFSGRHATVRIFEGQDPQLDSSIELEIDLRRLTTTASYELVDPVRGAP